jgi:hypothetical protein
MNGRFFLSSTNNSKIELNGEKTYANAANKRSSLVISLLGPVVDDPD